MDKKVTLNDIAEKSGVSAATVSLVLNKRPGVAQETRARVFEVAESLGYSAKTALSLGRSGRLATVGMIVKKAERDQRPQENPFYARMVMSIEDACRRSGINLLFASIPVDRNNRMMEVPSLLANDDLDGLLVVGAFVDEAVEEVAAQHRSKIVLVDGYSNTGRFDAVVSDNFRAAYQAIEYLIGKGHRHIAMAGGEADAYPSLSDRRNGYLRALKAHGISTSYFADFPIACDHGQSETGQLLAENPQITAVFGINDEIAIAAMRAAQSLGRRIPQDLAVIGYDDIYLAAHVSPPLTTMHVDTVAMGRAAVQLLTLRIENPDMARVTLTVHSTLVERETVSGMEGAGA
ncbi:MAG: LacI family DNA-binding transcriptional regulator [Chloroflexota bacterium]